MAKAGIAPIALVARVPHEPGEYIADRRMTFEEYLELDHERGLAEWIDGEVHFYVGATTAHQSLSPDGLTTPHFPGARARSNT